MSILTKGVLLCVFMTATSWSTPRLSDAHDTQSLDGAWDIVFDRKNEGREAGWHQVNAFSKLPAIRQIQVPRCWELIEKDYEGVAFYRRTFQVPEKWAGKVVHLHFGAVNYLTEVWLNGEVVGFHEGGFTPFDFRVDSVIKPGDQKTLILRMVGQVLMTRKRIDGIGQLESPQWRGGIVGGVWQSVQLVATGAAVIQDVFIVPKIADSSATFHLQLENTRQASRAVEVETTIRSTADANTIVASARRTMSIRPGVNKRHYTFTIPRARLWSPKSPHLYLAEVRVIDGETKSDEWTTRFGIREFTIRNKQFQLNGEPLFLKATFLEGLYPNGIAYPDSREMAKREIRLAKEAGFNMIRPWRRPPAPMWLDLADEMGVLVVGSPALECMRLPVSTPYLPSRVENEIRRAVLRDRNRTCVVQWELFNELHRPILKQMMRPMALMTRELDPTRLILDESGGWAFGARMYRPYEFEPTRFNDIHTYPGPFINKRSFDGFLAVGLTEAEKKLRRLYTRAPGRNVVPGLMSFVSELGYGSLPNLVENNERFRRDGNPLTPAYRYHHRLEQGQKRVLSESGFDRLYPNIERFCLDQQAIHGAANKRMIEAVRSNPEVSGYCIHSLAAGDWILGAGLIDLWRNPKTYAYENTKAANQPRILVLRMSPRNVYAAQGTQLEITGINELDAADATLTVHVVSGDGKTVYRQEMHTRWNQGIIRLVDEKLDTGSWCGHYIVKASIRAADGFVLAQNEYGFDVFSEQTLAAPKKTIAVVDMNGRLARFLKRTGVIVQGFDASTRRSTPVFVSGYSPGSSAALAEFIADGGTVVFARGAAEMLEHSDAAALPFTGQVKPAQGLWTCIPHLVDDHPIFAGLPSQGMMREIYENVWANKTLLDLPGNPIVASIGFEWFSHDHGLQYSGPGESWWGSDLAVIPNGKGRAVVSQLRIVENLGKDPVADKILFNLIRFADGE